jgi:O-methyltransferase involved in polyketide biosynthesis
MERETVSGILRGIADVAYPGSKIVFDYLENDAFIPGRAAKRVQIGMDYMRNMGKPMITSFASSTLAEDLERLGLGLLENLSPADIEERFFRGRTDGYHAYEHMHFARAVVA